MDFLSSPCNWNRGLFRGWAGVALRWRGLWRIDGESSTVVARALGRLRRRNSINRRRTLLDLTSLLSEIWLGSAQACRSDSDRPRAGSCCTAGISPSTALQRQGRETGRARGSQCGVSAPIPTGITMYSFCSASPGGRRWRLDFSQCPRRSL